MPLDFSKLGSGQTADTVLKPREIFNALPKKNPKFQYPRDVQSQVWNKWFERKEESSLVLKMNTGSGKTVVGLLILKSCLNEKRGPAIYVVPDKYLVDQVIGEATDLGLETVSDPKDERYLKGKAILVINIFKLVNGKSVFGIGDQGAKLPISTVLIDDAHACLNTIEEQFTLNISSQNSAYQKIFHIFESAMKQQSESKYLELCSGDPLTFIKIPYWDWQDKIADVTKNLINIKEQDEIKYQWPLIKDTLSNCTCVISKFNIEITPNCIPIDIIPSLNNAQHKIFMTATLADDSVLATHFGINSQHLDKPITPDSAGDVGDRIILFPQALNSNMFDSDVKKLCEYISRNHNVVVIVPSKQRSEFWSDISALTLDKTNIHEGVDKLKNSHMGLVVLINRYDGIDLPDSACRLLVIDGLPDARNQIDKVRQSELHGSSYRTTEIIHMIEQGMGRGVRSNDDYCAVILMCKDLTSQLYTGENMKLFSPATLSQLELSEQVAEQIKGKGAQEIIEVINYCLNRDPNWVKASRGSLASLNYSQQTSTNKVQIAIREAYDFDRLGNHKKAVEIISNEINRLNNSKLLRGVLKQVMAEYVNKYDKVEAQKIQLSAVSDNLRVLKPISGITYKPSSDSLYPQAVACSSYISHKFKDGNELIIFTEGVLSNLTFNQDSSNKFEQALNELAFLLGFRGERPENDYGRGPDNLWYLNKLNYLVIECKNRTTAQFINKHDCNQLNGSENWFKTQFPNDTTCVPIMIHNSTCFEHACPPSPNIKLINKELLEKFIKNIRQFMSSIANDNSYLDSKKVEESLVQYKLKDSDIVTNYTINFKIKS
ncbi:DEAD/DEAH box helicase family protein [Legionella micdadei]|uniref:DEAD/DEAH box helicase family protein n=1 Tax=Legionella micdadei TaxID=451 RepID=UPI003A8105F1